MTYRFREHSEGLRINVDYRNAEEREFWLSRDPIQIFRRYLTENEFFDDVTMDQIETDIAQEVEDCATFAIESPDPEMHVAFEDLYSDAYELEEAL